MSAFQLWLNELTPYSSLLFKQVGVARRTIFPRAMNCGWLGHPFQKFVKQGAIFPRPTCAMNCVGPVHTAVCPGGGDGWMDGEPRVVCESGELILPDLGLGWGWGGSC